MSKKRKRVPVPHLVEEMKEWSLEQLLTERIKVVANINKARDDVSKWYAHFDSLSVAISMKQGAYSMGISDHAVLRYLERHKGIDTRAVRLEIVELAQKKGTLTGFAKEQFLRLNGGKLMLSEDGVATTFISDENLLADAIKKGAR